MPRKNKIWGPPFDKMLKYRKPCSTGVMGAMVIFFPHVQTGVRNALYVIFLKQSTSLYCRFLELLPCTFIVNTFFVEKPPKAIGQQHIISLISTPFCDDIWTKLLFINGLLAKSTFINITFSKFSCVIPGLKLVLITFTYSLPFPGNFNNNKKMHEFRGNDMLCNNALFQRSSTQETYFVQNLVLITKMSNKQSGLSSKDPKMTSNHRMV